VSWLPASTYNYRLFFRFDGETISFHGGTSAGELGLLVLALNLEKVSIVGTGAGARAAAIETLRGRSRKALRTFNFFEIGMVRETWSARRARIESVGFFCGR
jgi:hypothetical protein